MFWSLIAGMVIASGLVLVFLGLRPRPQPFSKMLVDLEQPRRPSLLGNVAVTSSLLGSVAGFTSESLRKDLNILELTDADHARDKLQHSALFTGFTSVVALIVHSVFGFTLNFAVWMAVLIASAVFGWVFADRSIHQRADAKRKEFRSSLALYLSLVSTMLAGGSGIEQALYEVTRFGTSDGFRQLESALTAARTRDISPWVVFAEVAEDKALPELDELATSMEVAGVEGARIRTTLMTKAESLRHLQLVDLKTQAGKSSESMGLPVGVMMIGFILLVGYPAFKAIISI